MKSTQNLLKMFEIPKLLLKYKALRLISLCMYYLKTIEKPLKATYY